MSESTCSNKRHWYYEVHNAPPHPPKKERKKKKSFPDTLVDFCSIWNHRYAFRPTKHPHQTAFCKSKDFEKKWACVSCNYFLKTICLHPLLLIMYRTPAFRSTVSAFWIKMQWASLSLSRYCSHGHPRVRISCCDYTWWILQRADCSKMTSDRGRGNEVETQRWMPSYLSSRQECAIINYKKIVHWLIVILSGQCLMIYRSSLTLLSRPFAN